VEKTRGVFIATVIVLSLVAFAFRAGSEEPKGKPQSYEYTGVVKAKGEGTHILKVQTQNGPINFHYQRHGKKECAGFKELGVGDSVKVTAADNKPVSDATCILKAKPDPAPK
jgi:hypothetical protein